jgi:dUTP pyrophosphatase
MQDKDKLVMSQLKAQLKKEILEELRDVEIVDLKIQTLPNFHGLELKYQTEGAVGIDVCAALYDPNTGKSNSIKIAAGSVIAIPLGIKMEIPNGYEIQIRSRSSLSLKNRIVVGNGIGTIDPDYRGQVCAIIANDHVRDGYSINHGDRIGQIVLCKVAKANLIIVNELTETKRGSGGFGSTGKN